MCMKLTDVTMSEKGQIQRNTYCMSLFIWISRTCTTSLLLEVKTTVTSYWWADGSGLRRTMGCWNVLDLGPGGGFLGKHICKNSSNCTLEVYALYVCYTTYLVWLSITLRNYDRLSEGGRVTGEGQRGTGSLGECFRSVVSVWWVIWFGKEEERGHSPQRNDKRFPDSIRSCSQVMKYTTDLQWQWKPQRGTIWQTL